MSERRESPLYYPVLVVFVLLIFWLSYYAGAPGKPVMPGVENPVAPVIVAPVAQNSAEKKVLEGQNTPDATARIEAQATAQAVQAQGDASAAKNEASPLAPPLTPAAAESAAPSDSESWK